MKNNFDLHKWKEYQLFLNESADIRILTYKLLIEKFNERYNSFTSQQKLILKEYINNINDSIKLLTICKRLPITCPENFFVISCCNNSSQCQRTVCSTAVDLTVRMPDKTSIR